MDLQRAMCKLLIYGFPFFIVLKEGLAITCYMCNSNYFKSCDSFSMLPNATKAKMAVDCDQLEAANTTTFTMCRIITQDIKGESRIIRQCASRGNTGECYSRTGTHRIKMTYCECNTELCNKGHNLYLNKCNSCSIAFFIYLLLTITSA